MDDDHSKEEEKVPAREDISRVRRNSLYRLCWPFLILMRLGGMFFIQPGEHSFNQVQPAPLGVVNNGDRPSQLQLQPSKSVGTNTRKWEIFEWICMTYSFCIYGIGIAYGARFIFSVQAAMKCLDFNEVNLGLIVSQISYVLWIFQNLVASAIFIRVCLRPSQLSEFFVSWESLRFPCPVQQCKRFNFGKAFCWRRNVISGLCIMHCIVNWMATDFPIIIPGQAYSQLEGNLMTGFSPDNAGVKVLNFLGGLYTSFAFITPLYFFALIAETISIDFRHLTSDLAISVKTDGVVTLKTLEWFRLRHNSLCVLLDMADEIFAPWIALVLGCNIYQFLAQIYVVVALKNRSLVITQLNNVYWLLTFFIQLVLVLCRGSVVSEAAHGPSLRLYQIDQTRLSVPESLQLQSFFSKLGSTRIGFTAWKMIFVNYEALLVVLGTYITYQILIFQLQLDLGLDSKVERLGNGENVTDVQLGCPA